MSDGGETELMCLVDDGARETGVAILLRDGRPVKLVADTDGTDSVRLAIATVNGLLTGGVPWAAIVTLSADSPRCAFAVEQIADFLERRARPEPASTDGQSQGVEKP
jgi:hypothetical protein